MPAPTPISLALPDISALASRISWLTSAEASSLTRLTTSPIGASRRSPGRCEDDGFGAGAWYWTGAAALEYATAVAGGCGAEAPFAPPCPLPADGAGTGIR